jgi:hypothetical protein
LLITKLDDGGYLIERVSAQGPPPSERKERAINVLEMEESLLLFCMMGRASTYSLDSTEMSWHTQA